MIHLKETDRQSERAASITSHRSHFRSQAFHRARLSATSFRRSTSKIPIRSIHVYIQSGLHSSDLMDDVVDSTTKQLLPECQPRRVTRVLSIVYSPWNRNRFQNYRFHASCAIFSHDRRPRIHTCSHYSKSAWRLFTREDYSFGHSVLFAFCVFLLLGKSNLLSLWCDLTLCE